MKKLDLIEEGEKCFDPEDTVENILSKLTIKAQVHYLEQMNTHLYTLRGLYDNPLATKQHLDKLISENRKVIKGYGMEKPLQLVLGLGEDL